MPEAKIEDALARLAKNDPQGAENILLESLVASRNPDGTWVTQEAQEAAEAARNLGALAFYDNTQKALAAYRLAVKLDPDSLEGWNQLGHLLVRVGQLNDAEAAYGKVKAIAEATNDKVGLANAYANLGNVYRTRGDLGQAEAMYKKALALFAEIGASAQAQQVQQWLEALNKQ